MRVVLDTNVVLVCFSSRSKFYWIAEAFLNDKITLCFNNEMLLEYEEVVSKNRGKDAAISLMKLLLHADNKVLVTNYFNFRLLYGDEDDNKFVDAAVSAKSNYLVSQDKHFNPLKEINFPKVNVINIEKFRKLILK